MSGGQRMSPIDPDKHVVVLREAGTGKHIHRPMADFVTAVGEAAQAPSLAPLVERLRALETRPSQSQVVAPDPRVELIGAQVAALKSVVETMSGPAVDPRIDDLSSRLAVVEMALISLANRALAESEAA
jgi:hypothetical protein